ncbi:MAG: chloride channel protein [Thermoprotei archaeon]
MKFKSAEIYIILILIGMLTGFSVSIFSLALNYLTLLRESISNTILYLIIIFLSIPLSYTIVQRFSDRKKTGSGLDNFLEAYHFKHGFVTLRTTFFSVLSSLFTIGLGGSAGPEGPGLTIGGGIGSWFAQKFKFDPETMKRLHIVGAAAGIAAIFHAPLAGTVFALEIPYLHDVETEVFIWALITAIIAYGITVIMTGPEQLFPFESKTITISTDIIFTSVILGLLSAIVALLFIHIYRIFKHGLIIIPKNILPIFGGLIIVLIGTYYPQVLGIGYDVIRSIGFGTLKVTFFLVFALLFMKIIATSVTLNTGGSGGLFVPSIFIGTMLGSVYYLSLNNFVASIDYTIIIATTIAGVFAATNKTLLTSIVLVGETFGPIVLTPSIISATIAFLLTKNISIHENQLPSKKTEKELALTIFYHRANKDTLRKIRALQIMTKDPVYLDGKISVHEALNKVKSYDFKVYPVTVDGKYIGYVTLDILLMEPREKNVQDITILSDPIRPETTLHEIIERMISTKETHLYIVNNDNQLIGVVSQTDIIKTIFELANL